MAEMAEGTPSSDDPFHETVATTGLFLIFTAIISLAFALASWSLSEAMIAVFAGAIALVSFAASIFCFTTQATESTPATSEVSA
jgi:uncharacterized membrane protein YidH (DUF202 family)